MRRTSCRETLPERTARTATVAPARHSAGAWIGALASVSAAVLAGLLSSPPGAAATFVASSTTDAGDLDTGDAVCDTGEQRFPICTLRAAVQQANVTPGPDLILLAEAVYTLDLLGGDEDFSQSGDLDILDDLEIVGTAVDRTIIDGNSTDRVLHVAENVHVTLRRLTIRHGHRTGSFFTGYRGGGGLLNEGTSQLFDVALRDNESASGGGLFNGREEVLGGGNSGSAEASLVRVTVDGNIASALAGGGGGIFNAGTLTIDDSTLSRNSVPRHDPGPPFSPVEGFGGGLRNWATGNAILVDVTISLNSSGNGGGIANDGNLFVAASTIAFNVAAVAGEQLFNEDWAVLKGTILGGPLLSTPCGGSASVDSVGDNLEHGTSCGLDPFVDIVDTDPLLLPLGDWGGSTETHPISTASPALDAMADCRRLPLAPLTGDQRGFPRPLDGDEDGTASCDIGAYEVAPSSLLFFDRFESGDTSAWTSSSPAASSLSKAPASEPEELRHGR